MTAAFWVNEMFSNFDPSKSHEILGTLYLKENIFWTFDVCRSCGRESLTRQCSCFPCPVLVTVNENGAAVNGALFSTRSANTRFQVT